jgi:fumarate reductase flavoprotein subunit
LLDSKGRVTGVLAERDKEEFQIKARSVIISTGGFGGNKQILKKYFPYYDDGFIVSSLPYSGDGIKLAEEAGAAIEDFACMQKESGFGATGLIFCLMREPNLVCVNKIGVRFFDEDALGYYPMEGGNVIIRQPDQVYYCLFDEKIGQSMEEIGFLLGRPGVHRGESGQPLPGLRKELKTEPAYQGWAKIADSWDEIAKWIGAEPKVLEGTIDEYNHFCDQGYDEAFVKDRRYLEPLRTPPYYAVKIKPMMTDTIGPIRINERMEVLDSQCNPIAGLYAAGVITSGWQSEEYCSDICGTCMGYSTNSGRIAAENAVKFALGK